VVLLVTNAERPVRVTQKTNGAQKNKHKIATHYQFNFLIFKLRLFATTHGRMFPLLLLFCSCFMSRVECPGPWPLLKCQIKTMWLKRQSQVRLVRVRVRVRGHPATFPLSSFSIPQLPRFPCKQTKISVRNFIYAPYTATFCNFCMLMQGREKEVL